MKKIALVFAATLAATSSFAGSVSFVAPEVTMIEEPTMAGSGGWLIPLVIIAVLALALTQDQPRRR